MAGRGRNQPQPLQGADPALVQILQMMQNRDANRDNSHKQFLMFSKESFTGQDKKLAKSHWAEFSKYLDYQDQQGTIPRDLAHLPDIKSMFKLTLQDIALGWFETESANWLTEDQMKQSFLKRFNPWGDTRRQQQDAWNKLKFNMTKDDVDSFVVDMKTLASILGHNDDILKEKFKDVFPDPNIEAVLIAMDDFALMQKKAKQLVHIYKPAHDSPLASAAILVHTDDNTATKGKSSQPKSNQHQLAPINHPQEHPNTGDGDYSGGQRGRGRGHDRGTHGRGSGGNSNNRYDHQERGHGHGQGQRDFQYNRGHRQDNSYRGRRRQWDGNDSNNRDRDNRDRNSDGQGNSNRGRKWDNNNRGQGHSDRGRGRRWNPNQQYHDPGFQQESQFLIQIITVPHRWDINTGTQSRMSNTHIPRNHNNINHQGQLHLNKQQIFVSCAIVKATMTINVNLQAILWPAHKKPSIKADHTATRTLIMATGHKAKMITMTLMGNLFSSRGSPCH